MRHINKWTPLFVAFWQSLFLLGYISLVAIIFWKGNEWFGTMNNYFGPVIMLSLFTTSALICAIITLAYPFYLVWDKKETKRAIYIVSGTSLWMIFYLLIGFFCLILN